MLSRLDTDYIDLLLLHQQFGDYIGAWKNMEKTIAAGKVKAIGLSNFESDRLEEVLEASSVKPAVLQGRVPSILSAECFEKTYCSLWYGN